jgi:Domain of unknown function (DUF4062)
MSDLRKNVRIFLAYSGNLEEEREAVQRAVDEINQSWSDYNGVHFDLWHWKRISNGYGRPQELINQELDKCDLFIGMLEDKWGTPPDLEGRYGSGFEEEFERSMTRRREEGKPEIVLYFKSIQKKQLEDPGPQLKSVLGFRNKIEDAKELFYSEFPNEVALEAFVRQRISQFAQDLSANDDRKNQRKVPVETNSKKNRSELHKFDDNLVFLKELVENCSRSGDLDGVTNFEVARLRLTADSLSRHGNDDLTMGMHDLNILYWENRNGVSFKNFEVNQLVKYGLQELDHEIVPFWGWYTKLKKPSDYLIINTVSENDKIKVSALKIMVQLKMVLPKELKEHCYVLWFSKESSLDIKNAALNLIYLSGDHEDLSIVEKESLNSDTETSINAINCMMHIFIKHGEADKAAKLLLKSKINKVDEDVFQKILKEIEILPPEELSVGLEHPNVEVYTNVKRILSSLGVLENYPTYQKREKERRKINQHPLAGAFCDNEEEGLFKNDSLYFSSVETDFKELGEQLRKDIKNRFKSYFEKEISKMQNVLGDSQESQDLIERYRGLEKYSRENMTRKGLNILSQHGNKKDINMFEENLKSGFVRLTSCHIDFFKNYGDWEDLPIILKHTKTFSRDYTDKEISRIICYLGKSKSSDEILALPMSHGVLQETIQNISVSKFKKISDDALLVLLNHSSIEVRKWATIKAVCTMSKVRLKEIMEMYMKKDSRYYNVIHWLDLGVSLNVKDARRIAQSVLAS